MGTKTKAATTDKPLCRDVPVAPNADLIKIRTIRAKHLEQMERVEDLERRDLSVIGSTRAWVVLRDEDTGRLVRVHQSDWMAYLTQDAPRTRPGYDEAIKAARATMDQYHQLFEE